MTKRAVTVRLMQADDFDAVVEIDRKVLSASRQGYYEMKFDKLILSDDCLPTSLVAVDGGGAVIGFVMGELYVGEYGMQESATLDTIGVDPDCQQKGIGKKLIGEFFAHLRQMDVRKIITLIDPAQKELLHFFEANKFTPSKAISLERVL